MDTVAMVTFEDPARASEAMGALRRLADDGALEIRGAALVRRAGDGRWSMSEEQEEKLSFVGTIAGGLVGALLGLVAGPPGVLLGAATGAGVGGVADMGRAGEAGTVEGAFPLLVPPGTNALVADIAEDKPDAYDTAMAALGGQVHRTSREDVAAHMRASEAEERAAQLEE